MTRHALALFAGSAALAVTLQTPQTAEACGGTFCDQGPQSMPVDQTGEKIIFVMAEDRTEAHIQIVIDPETEADQFAWVIPITELPTFSVGADALFDRVVNATVPTFGFGTSFESCGEADGADGGDSAGGDGTGSGGDDGGGDTGGGPDVVLEETVGAFDIVVLSGGTSEEVMQWLGDNGYEQDPNAEPILQEYLAESYMFAAFKLTTGADVEEIHPVVLEFPNQEACIPLRLTRIAAVDNMEVRTFFLSGDRIVPRNYKHVLVNLLKLDWLGLASNYKELITMAVDNATAEGKAFVTEYAGPSNIVPSEGLVNPSWDATAFEMAEPVAVVDMLEAQGIMYCEPSFCEYYHLLLQGLLQQFLPVPDGIDENEFYDCIGCFAGLIDQDAWDAAEFSAAYQERIIDPAQHAVDILQQNDYLTRMYTTISPAEMTEDPFFYGNPDLEDVDLRFQIGDQFIQCDGDSVFTLPDGREVYVPQGSGWPDFPDEMPWAEDVEKMLPSGAPMSLEDNTATIEAELIRYNCQYDYPSVEACGGVGTSGGDDSADGGTDAGADGGDGDSASSGRGCACTSVGDHVPLLGSVLLGLGLVGLGCRRRRR